MGKTAFGTCCARRVGVLLTAILGICICSIGLSVFYVHTVQLSPSQDVVYIAGKEFHQRQHSSGIVSDDTRGIVKVKDQGSKYQKVTLRDREQGKSAEEALKVESLNNIDIALHIEKKKKEDHSAIPANDNKNTVTKKLVVQDKNSLSVKGNVREEDKWPTHNKDQKIKHKGYLSSNPLYEKPVRTRKNWNGEKYIVYLCHSNISCAGWGDRQHGIFSVYLISLMTNRTFKIDFSSPCPLTKFYHPRIANWIIEPSEFDGLSSTHLYAINDREFREFMKQIDFDAHFPQDVIYLTTNYDYYYSLKANPHYKDIFQKKIRKRPRPIIFADLWQSIFKMNKRVIKRYTPVLDKAHVSGNHKLVCAHIRFGRNPSIPNDGDIRNTLSSIKPFWDFVKKYSDPKRYRLFVASDWEGFRKKVNDFYKNIAVNMEGEIIHIDKYTPKERIGDKSCNKSCVSESETLCNGLEMVIADQHVLSKCDILLLTYSVFGKSAAYLRRSNKDLYLMDKGQIKNLMLFNERFNKH